MFKMIGGDGREYGPVTAEQLHGWILDHRANGQTMVLPEGAPDWQPLANVPEFASVLAEASRLHGTAAAPTSVAIPDVPLRPTVSDFAAPVTGELKVLDCLGRAWQLCQRNFLLIAGASSLAWGLQTLPQLLPQVFGCLGLIASLAVSGAMFGGLSVLVLKLVRGQPATTSDLFSCFDSRFRTCLVVFVVTGFLEELGLALCVLPGVFLSTVWAFSLPLAADRGWGFREALQGSWRAVIPRFFPVLGLLALAFLPLVVFAAYSTLRMVGFALDTLGPVGALDLASLREQLPELTQQAGRLGLQQQFVLFLNLPFAWTALMTAYEDLYGSRRQPAA